MGHTAHAGSVVVPNKGWVIYGMDDSIESEDSAEADALAPNFFLQLMLWQYYSGN